MGWGNLLAFIRNKPMPQPRIIMMCSVQSLSKEMFHRSMCMRLVVSFIVLNTELVFMSISFLAEKLQT